MASRRFSEDCRKRLGTSLSSLIRRGARARAIRRNSPTRTRSKWTSSQANFVAEININVIYHHEKTGKFIGILLVLWFEISSIDRDKNARLSSADAVEWNYLYIGFIGIQQDGWLWWLECLLTCSFSGSWLRACSMIWDSILCWARCSKTYIRKNTV